MARTCAVNVKHEDCDVYLGRAMPGFLASEFGNPFRIGRDGTRAQVLAKYKAWLLSQPQLMAKLESLRGKRLGCWCKPLSCHVDIIVELLEGTTVEPPAQGTLF